VSVVVLYKTCYQNSVIFIHIFSYPLPCFTYSSVTYCVL